MKRNQGFTLVELVIVIVILGILAVTAAPKFFNFATDARVSTLNAVKSSINSAGSMVYGKAVLEGKQAAATATLTSPALALVNGYPAATASNFLLAIELDAAEWDVLDSTSTATSKPAVGTVAVMPKGIAYLAAPTASTGCQVTYVAAATGAKPVVTVSAGGC